ncbi:MAG: hypothetical protein KF830_08360 [Planctomycetes bacterium]|nr:hypothetical protein [Planctomycetota bacterium]
MAGPAFLTAVAAELPRRRLSNEEIVAGMPWLDTSAEWIAEHTGILARHVVDPEEHATDLGLRAARRSLERSGLAAADTDLILLATNTAPFVYPAGAALIQGGLARHGLAMPRAAALDLQQGCASFVAGIVLGAAMVQSGQCRQVLVVGADIATRMLDWTDRSSVLLGDGATACFVTDRPPAGPTASPSLQILGSFLRTVPDAESIYQRSGLDPRNDPFAHMAFAAQLPAPPTRERLLGRLGAGAPDLDHYFHMDGRKVYRFVRRTVPGTGFYEVLQRAGLVDDGEFLRRTDPACAAADPAGEAAKRRCARRSGAASTGSCRMARRGLPR